MKRQSERHMVFYLVICREGTIENLELLLALNMLSNPFLWPFWILACLNCSTKLIPCLYRLLLLMLEKALGLVAVVVLLLDKEAANSESSFLFSSSFRDFASLIAWIDTSGDPAVLASDSNISYSRSWNPSNNNKILLLWSSLWIKAKVYKHYIIRSSAKGVFTIERARLVRNNPSAINGSGGALRLPPSRLSLERMTQSAAQGSEGKA